MSRAIRRQQASPGKEGGSRKPLGLRKPQPTRGARPPGPPRRRLRFGVPSWLEEIFSELRKVSWPSRDETLYLSMVVILVAISVGLILGGIDLLFNWVVDRLLLQ